MQPSKSMLMNKKAAHSALHAVAVMALRQERTTVDGLLVCPEEGIEILEIGKRPGLQTQRVPR